MRLVEMNGVMVDTDTISTQLNERKKKKGHSNEGEFRTLEHLRKENKFWRWVTQEARHLKTLYSNRVCPVEYILLGHTQYSSYNYK